VADWSTLEGGTNIDQVKGSIYHFTSALTLQPLGHREDNVTVATRDVNHGRFTQHFVCTLELGL